MKVPVDKVLELLLVIAALLFAVNLWFEPELRSFSMVVGFLAVAFYPFKKMLPSADQSETVYDVLPIIWGIVYILIFLGILVQGVSPLNTVIQILLYVMYGLTAYKLVNWLTATWVCPDYEVYTSFIIYGVLAFVLIWIDLKLFKTDYYRHMFAAFVFLCLVKFYQKRKMRSS